MTASIRPSCSTDIAAVRGCTCAGRGEALQTTTKTVRKDVSKEDPLVWFIRDLKLCSAAARRRFGLFLPGLICESSCLAAKRFPVRLTAARWAKARAGSIAREPYASPKTLECGGPAPLWPVSPWTHLRIKLSCCEAISRPVDRGKVGQSASGLDRTRTVCFAQNFGVCRPGAALARFSLNSFANQAVLLRSDFPSG